MSKELKNGAPENGVHEGTGVRKEFWLSSFSIKNRISVMVLVLLVAVMGIVSYLTIPKESFPSITVPNILW